MRPFTLLSFNFGHAPAIREVAADRTAIWTGVVLVLLTGIARNYDQLYFRESALWLIGPLLFSLFSGTFLYLILARRFARSHFPECPAFWPDWRVFMTLFWTTAPVAWLYAIPVERFFDSYQAAQANLWLLAIVSIWRVLLMTRILNVLWEIPFMRLLGWVIIAACLEIIIVFFVGMFFTGDFSRRILSGMSGMRNSAEETLVVNTLGNVWSLSWGVLILASVILGINRFTGSATYFPKAAATKVPLALWLILAAAWIAIAIPAQREQQRYYTHSKFIDQSKFSDSLDFLSKHNAKDFPPSRRLRPDPYEAEIWRALPPIVSSLNTNTPPWVRSLYLKHLAVSLNHYHHSYRSISNVVSMYVAMEKLPESREWMRTNESNISRQTFKDYTYGESNTNTAVQKQLEEILLRMGMSRSNLIEIF